MAQYIGYVQGSRRETSRLGSKNSGLTVTANAWNIGITAELTYDENLKTDVAKVYLTNGSSYKNNKKELLGTYKNLSNESN